MLSKTLQKRRQIDAWELDERELETKTDREMSMMSMMSTQLHLQCFNRPASPSHFVLQKKALEPCLRRHTFAGGGCIMRSRHERGRRMLSKTTPTEQVMSRLKKILRPSPAVNSKEKKRHPPDSNSASLGARSWPKCVFTQVTNWAGKAACFRQLMRAKSQTSVGVFKS